MKRRSPGWPMLLIPFLLLVSVGATAGDGPLVQGVLDRCAESLSTSKASAVLDPIRPVAACSAPVGKVSPQGESLYADVSRVQETVAVRNLYSGLTDLAMQRSFIAMMVNASQYAEEGKAPDFSSANPNATKDALALYVKVYPGFVKLDEATRKKIAVNLGKAMAEFNRLNKKNPIRPKALEKKPNMDAYLAGLKAKIARTNQVCARMRVQQARDQAEVRDEVYGRARPDNLYGVKPLANDQTSALGVQQRVQGQLEAGRTDANRLQNSPELRASLEEIFASDYGPLFMTDTFQTNVGNLRTNFVSDCLGGSGVLFREPSADDIRAAVSEVTTLTNDELKQVTADKSLDGDEAPLALMREKLKGYLADNPNNAADLLKKNPDVNQAKTLCTLVQEIDRTERWRGYFKKGLMATGAVAGAALVVFSGGAAAPFVAAAAMGVTVASAADAIGDYSSAKRAYANVQRAGVTRQIDGVRAQNRLGEEKEKKEDAKTDLALTVGAEAGGALIGYGIKSARGTSSLVKNEVRASAPASKSAAYFDGLTGARREAFDAYKAKIGFKDMTSAEQAAKLDEMYAIHIANNTTDGTVTVAKNRDLVALAKADEERLIARGVPPAEAKKIAGEQVRTLASKELKILGENPTQYARRYPEDQLGVLAKSLKADSAAAEAMKSEYAELLVKREELMRLAGTDPKAMTALKTLRKDLESIEAVYPKTAHLEEIKAEFRAAGEKAAQARAQAYEAQRLQREAEEKLVKQRAQEERLAGIQAEKDRLAQAQLAGYQARYKSYADVRRSNDVPSMREWSADMNKYGLVPGKSEVGTFMGDVALYMRTESNIVARADVAENAVALLAKAEAPARKSADLGAFNCFTDMFRSHMMPAPGQVVEALKKQFDLKQIGAKLSTEEMRGLADLAKSAKHPADQKSILDLLTQLKK